MRYGRICGICNSKFTTKQYNKLYCSEPCVKEYIRKYNKEYFKNIPRNKIKIYQDRGTRKKRKKIPHLNVSKEQIWHSGVERINKIKHNARHMRMFHKFKKQFICSSKYKRWTGEDILYIKNNFHNKTNREIAIALNRTLGAIHTKCRKLHLIKEPRSSCILREKLGYVPIYKRQEVKEYANNRSLPIR